MIKFFRNIRKNLSNKGIPIYLQEQTGNTLIYMLSYLVVWKKKMVS